MFFSRERAINSLGIYKVIYIEKLIYRDTFMKRYIGEKPRHFLNLKDFSINNLQLVVVS